MTTMETIKPITEHPYITRREDTCAGKPIIAGTRMRVSQIAIEYERMGKTPDEIVESHPHLTLAQVHDALSYYYDHLDEINADIRSGEAFIEELKKQYADSPAERERRGA
ncbi:MAG: DUF433 domain-containing protein [Candidatus Poribacteria bacterium]|nr:DUF433 domain-containing protein [Candidatus Poribacteria bacterium]